MISLTDNRYQFVLTGLKNTVLIAFCAALMGIVIGFVVAVIRSTHDKTGTLKIGNFICNLYLTIIRGTTNYGSAPDYLLCNIWFSKY